MAKVANMQMWFPSIYEHSGLRSAYSRIADWFDPIPEDEEWDKRYDDRHQFIHNLMGPNPQPYVSRAEFRNGNGSLGQRAETFGREMDYRADGGSEYRGIHYVKPQFDADGDLSDYQPFQPAPIGDPIHIHKDVGGTTVDYDGELTQQILDFIHV